MKNLWKRPAFLAVLFLVIYVIGLILGAYAVVAFPYYRKQKGYFDGKAEIIAQEYLEGSTDSLYSMASSYQHIYVYNAAGELLYHVDPIFSKSNARPVDVPRQYLSSVLSGREVYRLIFAREMQRSVPDIMAVSGIPIQKNGTIAGAVFFVKNLVDLPATLVGYALYFTVFYALTIFFFVSTTRRKQKLDKLQQNYIANVTHALKTPLASIRALTETLCDDMEPDPDQQKVYYGMILSETSRQEHMVRDILELSKLQSNGMDFSKEKISSSALFAPIWDKYAALCDCMGITLHISEEIWRLPPLYTNAACVKQLLEILLDNAIKFVPEGGGVWLDAAAARTQVTVCVRDNGVGISQDALPYIFERFYKGSHDFNASGSGLGLAIAKEIAAGLNEKIWVESKPNEGAAFFFTLHLKS